jgi:hypothetical protein
MDKGEEGRMVKFTGKPAKPATQPVSKQPTVHLKPSSVPKRKDAEWPAEGPHARADLINEDATPGSGLFSSTVKPGGKVDPGAG